MKNGKRNVFEFELSVDFVTPEDVARGGREGVPVRDFQTPE